MDFRKGLALNFSYRFTNPFAVHDPCLNVVYAALLLVITEDFSYTGSLSFCFFFFLTVMTL